MVEEDNNAYLAAIDDLVEGNVLLPEVKQIVILASLRVRPILLERIRDAQKSDAKLLKIIEERREGKHKDFTLADDGTLYVGSRVCVPESDDLKREILEEAHHSSFSVHPGSSKMYKDLKQFYWWSGMKRDVAAYVARCLTCQQIKSEHQAPAGTLQPLPIPVWKWERITMDFVTGLPTTQRKKDSIWVIVDRLTKSAHFLPIRRDDSLERLARLYIAEIIRLHGIPLSIVSDRDPRFTSRFWTQLQEAMGTKLNFSTAFHPQTDGQSERVIQILEDMLRACVIDFGGNWDDVLPLVEFSYNNSYQDSIKMAPYEALYGRRCRTPVCWDIEGERQLLGPEMIQQATDKVNLIKENLKKAQDRQKSYADKRRRPLEFQVGDHVFLKISPWKGVIRFGKRGKLTPRYIGPFEILQRIGPVAYRLALPPDLAKIHDVFHVSVLKKYVPDPSHILERPPVELRNDLSYEEKPVEILDRAEKVIRNKRIPLVKVKWRSDAIEETTWEREDMFREKYPHLFDPAGTPQI